jgi:hypothetical protein
LSEITDLARAIRPYLPRLIENDALVIDKKIGGLLEKAESGQEVDAELTELIDATPATRAWAHEFLGGPVPGRRVGRSFQPLPGDATPVAAQRYVCPKGDYVWYRPFVGMSIPRCPTHYLLLIPE